DTNEYLKAQGVLPHLRYNLPTGNVPTSYLAEGAVAGAANPRTASEARRAATPPDSGNLLHAIRDLQSLLGGAVNSAPAPEASQPAADEGSDKLGQAAVQRVMEALARIPAHSFGAEAGDAGGEPLAPADIQLVV